MTQEFATVAESELPEDGKLPLVLNGWPVLLCRSGGAVHAVINRCTHQSAALDPGRVRRGMVMCPLHGARFALATGKCAGGTYADLMTFAVRVEDGTIHVTVPAAPPSADFTPVGG